MRVFVTGASGFIGSAVVPELINAGHQVVGLARSDASAEALTAAGAEVRHGSLDDLDSLRAGAASADGVIHLAFIHNFDGYVDAAQVDRTAITTLGETLAGSSRPLVVTSGTLMLKPGGVGTEDDMGNPGSPRGSEPAAEAFTDRSVRVSMVRLAPSVHSDADKHGFVPTLIRVAREKGVSAYPGDGANRWPAVHQLDAARLFRLALESAPAGAHLHGVGDEGIPVREIAEAIGRHLDVPVKSVPLDDAPDHFGWIGSFFSIDNPTSNELTRQRLNWRPEHPGLIEDLDQGHYFTD
jgi:nucleoside-diphosphate-sugar epimerase